MANSKRSRANQAHRTAQLLGLGGALPFITASIGALILGDSQLAQWLLQAVTAYAAVILSFLGGIHWGLALKTPAGGSRSFIISVIPSLLAWTALLIPSMQASLTLLTFGFASQLLVDLIYLRLAPWFRNLRIILTCLVTASLVIALLASMQ